MSDDGITPSSGNLFEDAGLPNSAERSVLARRLRESEAELERARELAVRLEGHVVELEKSVDHYRNACISTSHEVEQILGKALGYLKFKNDPINFPNVADDSVCVGDHVPGSLASEAARRIAELEAGLRRAEGEKATLRAVLEPFTTRVEAVWMGNDTPMSIHGITAGDLRRARAALAGTSGQAWLSPEEAAKLQGQVTTMRAALETLQEWATQIAGDERVKSWVHANDYGLYCLLADCPVNIDAALAGTGDEVGAVVRAGVKFLSYDGVHGVDEQRGLAFRELAEKVADLLAKQPVWEVRRDG